jgi:hypothetical protein
VTIRCRKREVSGRGFTLAFFFFQEEREEAESGLVLFHEGIFELRPYKDLEESFACFERAKGTKNPSGS